MAFCTNCGKELSFDAKYCSYCGKPAGGSERKTEYEGSIHKCPSCGEVVNAFIPQCPTCGYEFRNTSAANSVRLLARKLEEIESGREHARRGIFKNSKQLTISDEQKINVIRSFAIPNTKEDLYEFLILASSNIDADAYIDKGPLYNNPARLAVSDAWKAMFEKAYQKALIVLADDSRIEEICTLYEVTSKKVKRAKNKTMRESWIILGVMLPILILMPILITISNNAEANKEQTRLEAIVEQIEIALDNDDYALALMNAERLNYDGYDSVLEEDWAIQKRYWINKIVDEAAKDGVALEPPIDYTDAMEDQ